MQKMKNEISELKIVSGTTKLKVKIRSETASEVNSLNLLCALAGKTKIWLQCAIIKQYT